jgi:DNA-binding NtrC family response regulator
LVVDDEKNIRRTLRMVLEGPGYDVVEAGSAEEALKRLEEEADIDLAVLDVRLPAMSGIEALDLIRKRPGSDGMPVIMISGHASLAEAVSAVQLGAADFLEKPLDRDRVLVSIENALRQTKLQREVARLRAEVGGRHEMIGQAPAMKDLFAAIDKIAPTKGRVLITGESGTGKELVARAIHALSDRAEAPFVMLNCAAIPAELIESELFGYERGAFTGAHGRKKGMFELADAGTLFLDEIGDMSLSAQAKVLRALQSGEITRVGSERPIAVNVRVLAATNKDLESEVADGSFRDDLYFRLNVVPIRLPSLRERVEDIPLLAQSFFKQFCREYGGRERMVEPEVFELLKQRPWPGNVRELKNVVERMVILSGHDITVEDVPKDWISTQSGRETGRFEPVSADQAMSAEVASVAQGDKKLTLREFRDRMEAEYLRATLRENDWNISRAASVLGIERTNLHKKMRAFGIRREG